MPSNIKNRDEEVKCNTYRKVCEVIVVTCRCSNPIETLYVIIICCCVLTQWQLYDPDGDSRQKVSNSVLSDGVERQP